LKAPIYAAAGVPEYWIVNLVARQVEVYRDPQPPRDAAPASYAPAVVFDSDASIPVELAGQRIGEISVADVLPPFAENQPP
jgi:Uma2 family endonuclease